jgi:hypothetical protein
MYSFSYNSKIKFLRTHVEDMDIFLSFYVEFGTKVCPRLSVTPYILHYEQKSSEHMRSLPKFLENN